ncbi:acetyl-CoA carboxylase biotin carboxyl carrier protein [Streptococcus sp. DD13]|uniref:acetyl-CoA carboxylase biotin carboxyl carrier protein n=1 Tax=Streptococcus sp. DD13 TaxID=1777881 RepID=UPI00079B69C1|nr:acetyl-CoA carboxylase biotin carboxyl carrier protein [Streptococcus sp. DD13]KXT77283.1 Biotin carboxyl carrier protein of acetyl-CoA carboxylase [Streptococcus sp. DD13]
MDIKEIKDLMAQFDASSLKEFSYSTTSDQLVFSKNDHAPQAVTPLPVAEVAPSVPVVSVETPVEVAVPAGESSPVETAEGDVVASPLVGVAYLAPSPDKPAFVEVGASVRKGQTLMIIEAMKVMNEVPAPHDGVVTEILVANEDVVEYGQGLVRLK